MKLFFCTLGVRYDVADHFDLAAFASHIGIGLTHDFLSNTSPQFLRLWLDECVNEHAYRQRTFQLSEGAQ
jgi:hypothetical protein